MRITRGDQCHAHHVGGQLGLRVVTPRRLKCTLPLHNAQHRVNIKTHSEMSTSTCTCMAHSRFFCWWRQVKWVNTALWSCQKEKAIYNCSVAEQYNDVCIWWVEWKMVKLRSNRLKSCGPVRQLLLSPKVSAKWFLCYIKFLCLQVQISVSLVSVVFLLLILNSF